MTGAAPSLDTALDASFCAALCTRLSTVPDLQLPSSLCREQPDPGPDAIQTFLQALLQRDPAGKGFVGESLTMDREMRKTCILRVGKVRRSNEGLPAGLTCMYEHQCLAACGFSKGSNSFASDQFLIYMNALRAVAVYSVFGAL
jgi:hypothetical protein